MLKSDVEITRIKNEEYIIKLADINSLYQEVCERNQLLEKVSKQGKTAQDEDYISQNNNLENFLTSGHETEEQKETSTPEKFTVNMKFNINKINKKEKKLSQFLNNNVVSKKQVVTKELEIVENNEESSKQDSESEKESDNNIHNQYNNNNILLTNSSFVSDYNSEVYYMDTCKTEDNGEQPDTKREEKPRNNQNSDGKKLPFTPKKSVKRFNGNTNNTHNTNNSISVYESNYDSKFNNDEYNSNAYECLKNIESNSNNTNANTAGNSNANANQGAKRRYDYDTNCFKDDE